jgi:hypothetical protein
VLQVLRRQMPCFPPSTTAKTNLQVSSKDYSSDLLVSSSCCNSNCLVSSRYHYISSSPISSSYYNSSSLVFPDTTAAASWFLQVHYITATPWFPPVTPPATPGFLSGFLARYYNSNILISSRYYSSNSLFVSSTAATAWVSSPGTIAPHIHIQYCVLL